MDYLFALMEGITGYVFRNAHHLHSMASRNITLPFISLNQTREVYTERTERCDSEHNKGILSFHRS